ncbi:hypothetical protein B0H13DRAFT_1035706 [Mycena leptocephala]|nr:hypothetical protein B0H13DRAFT_1035706 [Mycena leptocephala]
MDPTRSSPSIPQSVLDFRNSRTPPQHQQACLEPQPLREIQNNDSNKLVLDFHYPRPEPVPLHQPQQARSKPYSPQEIQKDNSEIIGPTQTRSRSLITPIFATLESRASSLASALETRDIHITNLERQLNDSQRDAATAARDRADIPHERRAIANERLTLTQAYAKLEVQYTTAEKKCAGLEDQCTRLKYKCGGIEYKCAALENKCTRLEKKCTGLESKCQTLGRERDVAYARLTSHESQHVRCAETITTQRVELEKLRVAPTNPPGGPWAALVSVQTENARLRSLLPSVSSTGTVPRRSRDGITKRKSRDQSEDELQSEPGSPMAIERLETADKKLETLTSTNKKLKAEQEFWVVRARGVEVANGGLGEECARLQAENTRLAAENAALLSRIAKSQGRRDQRVDGQELRADLPADNWQRDGLVAANGGVVDEEQVQAVPNAEREIVGEKRKQPQPATPTAQSAALALPPSSPPLPTPSPATSPSPAISSSFVAPKKVPHPFTRGAPPASPPSSSPVQRGKHLAARPVCPAPSLWIPRNAHPSLPQRPITVPNPSVWSQTPPTPSPSLPPPPAPRSRKRSCAAYEADSGSSTLDVVAARPATKVRRATTTPTAALPVMSAPPKRTPLGVVNSTPIGDGAARKLGISHLDLLYATTNKQMRCRLCAQGKQTAFVATAPWVELVGHSLTAHADECAELLKLSPAQVVEQRQRLAVSVKR